MSSELQALAADYSRVLAAFLDRHDEASLRSAYELGRRAVARGVGLLDIAAIHQQALVAVDAAASAARLADAAELFAECLTPFEMSLRGYQEANDQLIHANRELEQRNDDVMRASRAKSDFLAMMSHELRTPLNSIIGFSEVLEDEKFGALNERQHRYIKNVTDSGRHLLALINDLLDLSKVEAGRLEVVRRRFSARMVAAQAVDSVRPMANLKGIALEFAQADDTSLPSVNGDEMRFKQVLYNLLSNAIKFTPHGGRVTVTIASQPEHGRLRMTVSDTGPGISRDDAPRLFVPFSQLENARKVGQPGTGLGLALSKQLMELMGGAIGLENHDAGARFFVELPVDPVLPAVVAQATAARAGAAPLALIVDDDAAARELLALTLHDGGFESIGVATGEEALLLARLRRPAVILLDVLLPGISGWEVLRLLRSDRETSEIPVLLVTISRDHGKAFSLGALEHLVKPVRADTLLAALDRRGFTTRVKSKPMTVLVVDDDEQQCELMRATLQPQGFQVRTAPTGQAGIDLASQGVDLVLLDLMLPDLSGIEVMARLREDTRTCDLPVLLVTANELSPAERSRLNGEVEAVLQKAHLSQPQLLAEIRRVARGGAPAPVAP